MAHDERGTGGTGGAGAPAPGPGPSFQVGNISGSAVNFGAHGTATNTNNHYAAPVDTAQQELLAAVRELRADLARLTPRAETTALDEELAGAAEEIEEAGAAAPGRLGRLHAALASAGPVVEFLASGATVAGLLTQLLGG
ncbi:hypothetical protein ACWCQL_05645 [Streptomyces sp. NPDC002073]|uniref:hypothetical protein n=1 Tax=Streptomyces sp. NBC_00239 TaxID=2903640 RepID=UPI002E2D917A|nr:hypothetical protein [Streptomyces sp. NBC_00239]